MLNQGNHVLRPDYASVGRFFGLALELLDGDLGASQETIRLLATEPGLNFIKATIDRHVPEAIAFQDKVSLWRTQVSPLFRLITHPRAVDSNILEQEVAAVYSFVLGINASRMDRLFTFVADLAGAWPEDSATDMPLMAVLESSLAVLSKLMDCSTSNIINDTFQHIVERFDGLLHASAQPEDDYSKLQAAKYLDYLNRRLGLGKNMAEAKGPEKASVQRESFVIHRDLPGRLSRDGPRHNNDHAEISKISIMPTYEEITTSRSEYLPTNDSSQWHLPGIRGRLDREFRLLREDTVGQLRDTVGDLLQRIRNPGLKEYRQSRNSARTTTYEDATVQEVRLDKNKGLELTVRCRQPEVARKMGDKERRLWWDQCKRLQPGALICVLDATGMVQFFEVADSTLRVAKATGNRSDANEDPQSRAQKDFTLSSDKDYLYVKLSLVSTSKPDLSRVLWWYRDIGSSPRRYLVEFPGVMLASFRYTLEALQQLSQKPNLPFSDLIAPVTPTTGTKLAVLPPLFARASGFEFDLRCLTLDQKELTASLGQLPTAKYVSLRTGLDETQSEALLSTLSRELSLVQGPPGTGKSYTGEKIIKVLLANKRKTNLGPILCVCYTNHALDQLLEHLLDDGIKSVIRIGSRSKSERLQDLTLRVVADQMGQTRSERHQIYQLGQKLNDLEEEANRLLEQLSQCYSISAIRRYLHRAHRAHFNELFSVAEEGWQTVYNQAQNPVQRWLSGGNFDPRRVSRSLDVLESTMLANMTQPERLMLHRHWLKSIRDPLIDEIIFVQREHSQTKEQRERARQDVRHRCLQEADIVGATTTGLARELSLLRKLRSKVVLCEEAGEVLEAHSLTTLLPSVEQAIFIGDHLQLRPQIQNYELQSTNPRGSQYSLDMSLFERLVQPPHSSDPRLPVSVLETQRRMHPSIAEMVRSTLYRTLKDGENVTKYPPVVGMRHRLFWLQHEELEAGAAAQDPQNTSHSNLFEVEMTAALISHLVRQGSYNPEDIAVLTPYLGQLQKLRTRMAAESTFAVSLGERDIEDLEELEESESEKMTLPKKQSVGKTTLLRSVRLATVDNFQGEEAKVVIISLVRSNAQNRCGFLSTSNRINVLMSRAKHGCYIIGNAKTYSHVPMWNQIIQMLQANGNFGTELELQCPRHPDTPIGVSQPDHFMQFAPDAGCTLPCDRRLDCGHACHGRCHSDLVHNGAECTEDCPRPKKGCDHPCPLKCGVPCEERCNVQLRNINLKLPCGHIVQSAKCWQAQNPGAIKCEVPMERKVPGCDHTVTLPCRINVNLPQYKCNAECGHILPCGHSCRTACHVCNVREEGKIIESNHGFCKQVCGRKYTTCPHTCQQTCHGEAKCGPCMMPCDIRCSHSRCSKRCHEPCAPCAQEKCASSCPHGSCTMPCAAPCDWVPCSKRCTLLLSCNHQCPSLCGEACPDSKYCRVCGSEDVLSRVVDFYEMNEYRDIDVEETPCIFPDCGHFYTVESMDGQMDMGEHYVLDDGGMPISIKTASKPFSMDEVKACSECRGSLRNVSRYGRIVRRAMLDETTKKFISWSTGRHLELAEALLTEQQILEENDTTDVTRNVGRPGHLNLTGPAYDQIKNMKKWVGHKRYDKLVQIFITISKYKDEVSVEEQPFHKVCDFVRHANRSHKTQGAFVYDEDMIQRRGYLLAISLLLKCNVALLSDFMSLWKGAAMTRTEINVDFSANFAQCEELIKLAAETSRPQLQVEGHTYYAHFCGLALALGTPRQPSTDTRDASPEADAVTATTTPNGDDREALKNRGLQHLEQAKALLENANWGPKQQLMEAEMEAVAHMLNGGVFYRSVTADELRAVYAAMAAEFSGTGHWYNCEQGHPFTVGECGMPMEQARCPECDSPVGGQNHSPAEGVRRAEDIEALAMGVGGMRI